MVNIEKQIDYWIKSAENDIETAGILIREGRILHGMFFCHLTIEKAIKSLYVNERKNYAPKTHNLIFLSEKANIKLNQDQEIFVGILMKYQLEGRYPDYDPIIPSIDLANYYLNQTKIGRASCRERVCVGV